MFPPSLSTNAWLMENFEEQQQKIERDAKRIGFWWNAFWVAVAVVIVLMNGINWTTLQYAIGAGIFAYAAFNYLDRRFKRTEARMDHLRRD